LWHTTDIGRRLLDVRFWEQSGHHAASAPSALIGADLKDEVWEFE
jgi:hypothetical protein